MDWMTEMKREQLALTGRERGEIELADRRKKRLLLSF